MTQQLKTACFFQRISVWFPASISGSSQLSVTPTPRDPLLLLTSMGIALMNTHTHTPHKNKISLGKGMLIRMYSGSVSMEDSRQSLNN